MLLTALRSCHGKLTNRMSVRNHVANSLESCADNFGRMFWWILVINCWWSFWRIHAADRFAKSLCTNGSSQSLHSRLGKRSVKNALQHWDIDPSRCYYDDWAGQCPIMLVYRCILSMQGAQRTIMTIWYLWVLTVCEHPQVVRLNVRLLVGVLWMFGFYGHVLPMILTRGHEISYSCIIGGFGILCF